MLFMQYHSTEIQRGSEMKRILLIALLASFAGSAMADCGSDNGCSDGTGATAVIKRGVIGLQGFAGASNVVTKDEFNSHNRDMYGATSAVLAVAGLPQPTRAGATLVSAAVSTYHGQQGFAVGLSHVTDNERWVMKAGVSTSTAGAVAAVLSGGYQF